MVFTTRYRRPTHLHQPHAGAKCRYFGIGRDCQWYVHRFPPRLFPTASDNDSCALASAPNNGSYTWYSDFGNALYYSVGSSRSRGAASGCNYTFSLKVWQNEYYSPYFTIIKPVDGGIPSNATCPQDLGIERPRDGEACM